MGSVDEENRSAPGGVFAYRERQRTGARSRPRVSAKGRAHSRWSACTTQDYRLITSVVPADLLVVPELCRLFLRLMRSRLGVTTVSIAASHLDQFVVQTEQQKCRRPLTHEGAGVLAPRELQTERKPDRTHRRPEVHVGRYLRCLPLDASSDPTFSVLILFLGIGVLSKCGCHAPNSSALMMMRSTGVSQLSCHANYDRSGPSTPMRRVCSTSVGASQPCGRAK